MDDTQHETLRIDKDLEQLEAELATDSFYFRLVLLWLTLGNAILVGLVIAGNLLIDFSSHGHGRPWLNTIGVIVCLASLVASAATTIVGRTILIERRSSIRKLEVERRHVLAAEAAVTSATYRQYRDDVPIYVDEYRRGADRYRKKHNRHQVFIIVGSILNTIATTAATSYELVKWVAVALSAIVSISAGITGYFKFRERSVNLQQTADAIDQELQALILGIRRYKGKKAHDAEVEFAEEVERLREDQRKREQQLDQPPEVSARTGGGSGGVESGSS